MRKRPSEEGSVSTLALVIVVFLAALSSAAFVVTQASLAFEGKANARAADRQALEKEADRILQLLPLDGTPDADSPFDSVWAALTSGSPGVTATLDDLSSALNPNWVQKYILEGPIFADMFNPGHTPAELQQRREDKGFFTDIQAGYGDLFKPGIIGRYFTGYNWPNINTTDEFALRKLYTVRTGNAAMAEVFHQNIQDLLRQGKRLKKSDLQVFLGIDYDRLFPLVNVEPQINVNFADPLVLRALLGHPGWNIGNPEAVTRDILSRRGSEEIPATKLKEILGVPADSEILNFLGSTTWFWKISVSRGSARLDVIAARVPQSTDLGPRSYFVIEERYSS